MVVHSLVQWFPRLVLPRQPSVDSRLGPLHGLERRTLYGGFLNALFCQIEQMFPLCRNKLYKKVLQRSG